MNNETLNSGGLRKFIDGIIRAYLDGKLQVKDVAAGLATHMEVDGAETILNRLVQEGRLRRDEADEIVSELVAVRSVENRIAAASGTVAGGGTALTMVSGAGAVAGLSASGITSGLAALGGLIGGGMAMGLLVTAGGAFVAGAGVFFATKRLVRFANERSLERKSDRAGDEQ